MQTKVTPSIARIAVAAIPDAGQGRISALDQQVRKLSGNIHQAAGRMLELLDNRFYLTQGKIAAADHGGEMWTESGGGARFVVRLPQKEGLMKSYGVCQCSQ